MLALVVRGTVRLRRRGAARHAGGDRIALAAVAVGLVLLATSAPLDEAADERLSVHMLQHVLLGDLAPALLLVALRGPLLVFVVPRPLLRRLRPPGPIPTLALWAAVLGAWHVPALYDYALSHELVHEVEHGLFAAVGFGVWWQLLRGPLRRPWGALGYALALFALGMLLANALVLSYRPLYPAYGSLGDQQAAALVMLAEQALTLGTLALVLLRAHFRALPRRPPAAAVERHPFAV